jgi:hypothetical protein
MTSSVLELLTRAQDLIRDPAHWTQGVNARDKNGFETNGFGDEAVCFCSYGAFYRITARVDDDLQRAVKHALGQAVKERMGESFLIATFNDTHTHAEVMAMWDRAKELAA